MFNFCSINCVKLHYIKPQGIASISNCIIACVEGVSPKSLYRCQWCSGEPVLVAVVGAVHVICFRCAPLAMLVAFIQRINITRNIEQLGKQGTMQISIK